MAAAQREGPNSYWLLRWPTAGSREALQRVVPRLVEEEEAVGEREAFANSSGGTPKLA